ncbi:MAG: TetR family transcriptional regulator, partial [Actinomycetota bacterium]
MSPSAVERGADTRHRLLGATAAVIARDGWGAVTTRRVAEEAGLTSGLVHYHFSSVDDLRRQATVAALDRFLVPV